jgi:choline kinase
LEADAVAVHATTRRPERTSAVILAAGAGRRLGMAIPKVLLEFGGRTLLERHVAALHASGVQDIAITVGYRAELIRDELARIGLLERISLVDNPRSEEGSVVSLWAQRERLEAGATVLVMDGDVLYDKRMIARLLAAAPENVLLFDRAIEAGDEPVKICMRGDVIVDFAKVPERAYDHHGESVGFFRFSPAMSAALADRVVAYVETGRSRAEYESAIRDLILAEPHRFGCADISDLPWTEIDFDADVARARREILPQLEGMTHG